MTALVAFALGVLFALGLGVGGMLQPGNIIGFLNVAGAWNPALMLVLGGAVGTYMLIFRLSGRRARPLLAEAFVWPGQAAVDRKLVAGAVVFGVGWGISGFCPGPAVVGLVTGSAPVLVFVAAMIVGMLLQDRLARLASRQKAPPEIPAAAGSADG